MVSDDGFLVLCFFVMFCDEVEVIDIWYVVGMCLMGFFDIKVDDVFVLKNCIVVMFDLINVMIV